MQYRFAHEYHIRPGETMESIADRFGTDVETLVHLNKNLITSLHNPRYVHVYLRMHVIRVHIAYRCVCNCVNNMANVYLCVYVLIFFQTC